MLLFETVLIIELLLLHGQVQLELRLLQVQLFLHVGDLALQVHDGGGLRFQTQSFVKVVARERNVLLVISLQEQLEV